MGFSFLNGKESLSENRPSASKEKPVPLIFPRFAAKQMLDTVGWGKVTPNNKNEMGGKLIGYDVVDANGHPIQTLVVGVILADSHIRTTTYVEWSELETIRMNRKFYALQDAVEAINPEAAKRLRMIGWFHTHVFSVPVWMSDTDMITQRKYYKSPNQYSVILNPHTMIWKAFAGSEAVEVPAVMLLDNDKELHNSSARSTPGAVRDAVVRLEGQEICDTFQAAADAAEFDLGTPGKDTKKKENYKHKSSKKKKARSNKKKKKNKKKNRGAR